MNIPLQFYKYTCHCGNIFKSLEIIGTYGSLLLRSEIDELAYLNCSRPEFNEISKIVHNHPKLKNEEQYEIAGIFQEVFSLACDLSPQNKIYFLTKHPNCPQCHSPYKIKNWIDVYPAEVKEVDIPLAGFNNWNRLNQQEKIDLINRGLEFALKKAEELSQARRNRPSWPDLSSAEKDEAVEKIEKLKSKHFKIMLAAFRKIHGLNPSSPIGNNVFFDD